MKKVALTFLSVLFLVNASSYYTIEHIEGKTVAITDGDTFKLLTQDSTLVRVRVANIDCPERKQPFYQKAKQFTSQEIFDKRVKLEVIKKDRYGRLVALVKYDDSLDLSQELLKNGFAWHYLKYSKDSVLQDLHDEARKNKVGLWQDPHAMAPWEWRSSKRKSK
ncbi:thermonuclease family protein [Seonamhaeicola sp. ML3]|uniref:thermonuclease family protein n=1 Tax=Seonamhaeicola sp. ML3 TaxID=2937786 RepID=UPI00200DC818|nr:thermonuclease family protein [Seonamhaeicola sp. ML3]